MPPPKYEKLVPGFCYPAFEYANKVEIVLRAAEPTIDFSDADVSVAVLPLLIRALPNEIIRIAQVDTLSNLINWLKNYDKPQVTLDTIFNMAQPVGTKPSVFYQHVIIKVQNALPNGTAKKTVETIAWSVVRKNVTQHMKAAMLLLDASKPPDAATWTRIDEMNSNADVPTVNMCSSSSYSSEIAALTNRLSNMEEKINDRQQKTIELKCFRCGTAGHFARNCPQETPVSDLCYYHKTYAGKARKCIQPCRWSENYKLGAPSPK